jgi:endonuclease YncB( thermonuclease family)
MDQLGVFWTPAGFNIPDIGTKALVDVTDGDTPTIQMPIRMLSVDTPEVTARSEEAAARIDAKFAELAGWIEAGQAPVTPDWAAYILPKLKTGRAGTLQLQSGKLASQWFKAEIERRLARPDGSRRRLFVRISEAPFDNYGRLLAYISPQYSKDELVQMSRADRATFNLGLVEAGWASAFVLFPNIPGELDLPLFVDRAVAAYTQKLGQWSDPMSMPGYEYRMCEKLHGITKKLVGGESLKLTDRMDWRSRYCADLRTRELHGPEKYMNVPPPYRMWIWPQDTQSAVGKLNLVPHSSLVALIG